MFNRQVPGSAAAFGECTTRFHDAVVRHDFFFNTISVPKKCLFEFRRIDNDTMLARHLDWFANLWRGQLCDQSCCAEYLPSVGSVDCIEKINLAFTNDQTLCREFQRYAFYFEVLEVECTLLSCFRSHKKIQKK